VTKLAGAFALSSDVLKAINVMSESSAFCLGLKFAGGSMDRLLSPGILEQSRLQKATCQVFENSISKHL
jgi:hypothetical protein